MIINFQSDNGMINQNNNNFKSDDSVSNQNNINYQSENGLNNNNNCIIFNQLMDSLLDSFGSLP